MASLPAHGINEAWIVSLVDSQLESRSISAKAAQTYLRAILDHVLRKTRKMSAYRYQGLGEGDLALSDRSLEHLNYSVFRTLQDVIKWAIDRTGDRRIVVTEVEELVIGSDSIWYTRQDGLDFENAAAVMETMRQLISVASTTSDDPDDEARNEEIWHDMWYYETHGVHYPHEYEIW
mmetsp:Transcript_39052/g.107595  ORF Transcript_39052/g.107595 Transcript_39052/m.107595 type:complete len:177 (+) Transcript_39052:62-592(+)|eukprot:CAMPEP_0117557122 /NCGR_PEP_ID=MMETSP0784-20121206/52164_1 /TAXON_ID=39447 /ORGANISM="" /LENGTH=176 /DNA_ID=CAMNT_0005354423 /DNA_START=60 /DNA_END=590 /DNA_ORIENTATION=+